MIGCEDADRARWASTRTASVSMEHARAFGHNTNSGIVHYISYHVAILYFLVYSSVSACSKQEQIRPKLLLDMT